MSLSVSKTVVLLVVDCHLMGAGAKVAYGENIRYSRYAALSKLHLAHH